ncbi:hypothetical protein [Microbulbifer sp. THAF38]|uniref:hypothetical protein n=1 Tax=Microbulbifer sp. THAF38 TaxID=2587856 RepID=UPI0012697934|nr:hypothetical protein [Microbulbifer sp. THAF38]QFT55610.1 hypothetical protein FIU95_13730 [Microbulbifer sp. THAF38]
MTTELIASPDVQPVQIFAGNGLDAVLEEITSKAKSVVADADTAKGRKTIASIAHQVARSKTYLDSLGKDLVADQKAQIKKVDSERKRMRDYLDNLKTEVRKPLTDWEEAENLRVAAHKNGIACIERYATECSELDSEDIQRFIDIVQRVIIDERWEEFEPQAARVKEETLRALNQALEKRKAHEQQQAELAQLLREKAEREQKEREERIAQEAAERVRKEAELEKQAAIEAKERAEREAKESAERAERQAKEAAERAEQEKREAVERERQRAEAERRAAEEEQRLKEANKTHCRKINNAAKKAFIDQGFQEKTAQKIVELIVRGSIPNISINY